MIFAQTIKRFGFEASDDRREARNGAEKCFLPLSFRASERRSSQLVESAAFEGPNDSPWWARPEVGEAIDFTLAEACAISRNTRSGVTRGIHAPGLCGAALHAVQNGSPAILSRNLPPASADRRS